MKQICEKYCIDLIRAVMQETEIPAFPEGLSLQSLYEFAKKHSVEALVFHGLEQLDMEEENPIWQNWCNRAQMLLTQSIVQLTDRDLLFEELTAEGIDLLPVKGCWLKEDYPEIDYRQMGDLDMLIRKADREKIHGKMVELGYAVDEHIGKSVHISYAKPPYTEVEMHFTLLPWDDPRHTYYEHVWEKAECVDGNVYLHRLTAEDEYIYYILHLQKHAMDAGIGIKAFLDSVVYRKCYPKMNRNYLRKELQLLNAWEFTKQVEKLADCWFDTGEELPKEVERLAANALEDGVFGTEQRMMENRLQKLEEKYKNPLVRSVAYWLSRLFLPREEMECWYPILEKYPFLLPFCWGMRLVMACIRKPKMLLRQMFIGSKGGKKND